MYVSFFFLYLGPGKKMDKMFYCALIGSVSSRLVVHSSDIEIFTTLSLHLLTCFIFKI